MCSKYVDIFFTRSCIHAHRPPPLRLESGRFPPSFFFVAGQVSALLAILVQVSAPANMADSKHCKLCDTDKKEEEMQDNNRCRDCNPMRQRISKLAADPATGKFFEDLTPAERTKFYQDHKADSEIVMVDRGFMVDLPSSQGVNLLAPCKGNLLQGFDKGYHWVWCSPSGGFCFSSSKDHFWVKNIILNRLPMIFHQNGSNWLSTQ